MRTERQWRCVIASTATVMLCSSPDGHPMKLPYDEFDLSGIKTYPLRSRQSKVELAQFATPYKQGSGVKGLLASLPGLLAAKDFKDVVTAIVNAKRSGKAIIWGLGAHVLKTGLAPVLVDLMERGFVSAI